MNKKLKILYNKYNNKNISLFSLRKLKNIIYYILDFLKKILFLKSLLSWGDKNSKYLK